jgi:hypothetical protein
MSNNATTPVTIAKPGRPWEPSLNQRIIKVSEILISITLAFVLYFATGLNGKLGFFAALLISILVVTYIAEFRRAGKPAAEDSL